RILRRRVRGRRRRRLGPMPVLEIEVAVVAAAGGWLDVAKITLVLLVPLHALAKTPFLFEQVLDLGAIGRDSSLFLLLALALLALLLRVSGFNGGEHLGGGRRAAARDQLLFQQVRLLAV